MASAQKSIPYELLSGADKAAVLMLALPSTRVKDLLQKMDDSEVERILASVSRFEEVPSSTLDKVLREFQEAIGTQELSVRGGRERAMALMQAALEGPRAEKLMEKLGRDEKRVDWTLREYTPAFIADVIKEEHPQTIALIVSQIPTDRGSSVVAQLPDEVQAEVLFRIAGLESVSNDVVHDLEEELSRMFARHVGAPTPVGGTDAAAKLLNGVPKTESQTILEGVDARDPDVAGEIRKRMLTFNDLNGIDKRGFQTLLREIPTEDLVVALKTASDEMQEKVFSNVSSRAADQIREEAELLSPMRLSEIETIQQQIVDVARRLEEEGVLTIDSGGGGDDVLV